MDIRRAEIPPKLITEWSELEELYAEEDGIELTKPVPEVSISNLDIRVGVIDDIWKHEAAENLYCMDVNVGEAGTRLIVALLKPYYQMDELKDQKVLVVVNVKEQVYNECPSHGMVLAALSASHSLKEIIQPPEDAVVGEKITVEGFDGTPVSALSGLTNDPNSPILSVRFSSWYKPPPFLIRLLSSPPL